MNRKTIRKPGFVIPYAVSLGITLAIMLTVGSLVYTIYDQQFEKENDDIKLTVEQHVDDVLMENLYENEITKEIIARIKATLIENYSNSLQRVKVMYDGEEIADSRRSGILYFGYPDEESKTLELADAKYLEFFDQEVERGYYFETPDDWILYSEPLLSFNCTEVYVNTDEAKFIPVKCRLELGNSIDGSLVQTTMTIDVPEEETEGYTLVKIDRLAMNQPYATGIIGGFTGEDNEEDYIRTFGGGNRNGVLFGRKSTPIASKSFYDMYGNKIRPIQYIAFFAAFIIAIVPTVIRYSINRRNYEIFEYRRKMTDAMAHDLKTPLAAISAYAENLQSHIGTDKQEHYAEKIIEKVDNMNKMVNDILVFSRSENSSGVITSEDVDVGDLIKEIIAENDQIIKDKDLKVDVEGKEVTLKTDKTLIRQALGNLINNAVLYSKDKSTVTISYDKDQIKIVNDIADNVSGGTGLGIAIADNDLAMLKYKLTIGREEDQFICVIRM